MTSKPTYNRKPVTSPDGPAATRKTLASDAPTWCPGCGDFAVLNAFLNMLEEKKISQNKVACIAGIGCSSRIPYFVNTYGVHFLHGRALPFATGLSLTRPDLDIFVFTGDGDTFSIGGNHFYHAGRKNINLTHVIMDNFIYGLTKKQTSPTTPMGAVTKTDPLGVRDYQVNPMRNILTTGATFVARTSATRPKHLADMLHAAHAHHGFSVVEVLCECRTFFRGVFSDKKKHVGNEPGGFELLPDSHDPTDINAALAMAELPWPGKFGIFYHVERPSKNQLEAEQIKEQQRIHAASDKQLMREILQTLI